MKYKTSELNGAMLDAAVAKAEGFRFTVAPRLNIQVEGEQITADICRVDNGPSIFMVGFFPSSDWAHGGQIIEREGIAVEPNDDFCDVARADKTGSGTAWHSYFVHDARPDGCQRSFAVGPTPLTAAMRGFVAGKMGEEVDL